MQVMTLVVRLKPEKSTTARQRRLSIESIVDTIHRHFNVSIADIGLDAPNAEIILAATCVGRSRGKVRDVLDRVAEALCSYPGTAPANPPEFLSH